MFSEIMRNINNNKTIKYISVELVARWQIVGGDGAHDLSAAAACRGAAGAEVLVQEVALKRRQLSSGALLSFDDIRPEIKTSLTSGCILV